MLPLRLQIPITNTPDAATLTVAPLSANAYRVTLSHPSNAWLGLALGTRMLNSPAIVGMDPTANPTRPAVGLYSLKSKTNPANEQLLATLASSPTASPTGISQASFTQTPSATTLAFTLNFTSTTTLSPTFPLTMNPSPNSIMVAVGFSPKFQTHLGYATTSVTLPAPPPTTSPTMATAQPTTSTPTLPGATRSPTPDPTTPIPTTPVPTTPVPTTPIPTTSNPTTPDQAGTTTATLTNGKTVTVTMQRLTNPPRTTQVTLTYANTNGAWLGFGFGSQMVGSTALVGMDPTQQPPNQPIPLADGTFATNQLYPPTGMYALTGEVDATQQLLITSDGGAYGSSYSLTQPSFTRTPTSTSLSFQTNATALTTDCLIAVGASATFAEHDDYAVVSVEFPAVAGAPTRKPTKPIKTKSPTPAPTSRNAKVVSVPQLGLTLTATTTPANSLLLSLRRVNGNPNNAPNNAWFAFGFGSQMVGSRSFIALDPTAPGNAAYPPVGIYAMDAKLSASDMRLLALGDNATFTVTDAYAEMNVSLSASSPVLGSFDLASGNAPLMFAVGSTSTLAKHSAYKVLANVGSLLSAPGDSDQPANPTTTTTTENISLAMTAHVVLMILAFIFFFPAGASAPLLRLVIPAKIRNAHVFEKFPTWINVHKAIQTTAVVLAVAGMIPGFVAVADDGSPHLTDPHHILGLALVVGAVVQLANGWLRPHVTQPPTPTRRVWYQGHRLLALFVVAGGIANCIVGASESLPDYANSADAYVFAASVVTTPADVFATTVTTLASIAVGLFGVLFVLATGKSTWEWVFPPVVASAAAAAAATTKEQHQPGPDDVTKPTTAQQQQQQQQSPARPAQRLLQRNTSAEVHAHNRAGTPSASPNMNHGVVSLV